MAQISIVVPVYNVEKYLRQCLESIVSQSFADLEIICVDDGSTDMSGIILDEFKEKDERITVIHKENTGYGATMNIGISLAKGKYVGFIESDDFIEQNMYAELYELAEKYELDFIKSDYWIYSDRGKQLFYGGSGCRYNTVFSQYENMNKLLASKSIWSGIYKKEFLINNHIFFLDTPGASYQDTSFWFKVGISAKKGYFLKKAYVNYRIDNAASSVRSQEKVYSICDEMDECKRFLLESELDVKKIYPYFVLNKKNVYLWNAERIAPQFRREFVERASFELQQDIQSQYMDMSACSNEAINDLKILTEYAENYYKYISNMFTTVSANNQKDCIAFLMDQKRIYIYGAGHVGHICGAHMKMMGIKNSIYYVVTETMESGGGTVFRITDKGLDMDAPIIIAVKNQNARRQMVVTASAKGFKKIYVLGDEVIRSLE